MRLEYIVVGLILMAIVLVVVITLLAGVVPGVDVILNLTKRG